MQRVGRGPPGSSGCGAVFHKYKGFIRGCLAIDLGHCFDLQAKLLAMIHVIDYAWLDCFMA